MMEGWVCTYRRILDNPLVNKDTDHFCIWMYLLLNAVHSDVETIFNGRRVTLHPGQLITSARSISNQWGIDRMKVQRVLKAFETDTQIEQQMSAHHRLITVVNWRAYQGEVVTQNDKQMRHNCDTSVTPYNNNEDKSLIKILKNNITHAYEGAVPHEDVVDLILEALDEAMDFEKPRSYGGKVWTADDFARLTKQLRTNDIVNVVNRILPHRSDIKDVKNYALCILAEEYK